MPDSSFCLAGRGDDGLETFVDILELVGVEGKGRSGGVGELGELGELSRVAAAPRSATAIWSTGTCHVARLTRQLYQRTRRFLTLGVHTTTFPKAPSPRTSLIS